MAAATAVALVAAGVHGARGGRHPQHGTFVGSGLHSLVADPTQPGRLYLGGHNGVAMSNDGGHRFVQVPSLRDADAMGWAFTPSGVIQGGHPGLRRSSTGGTRFASANDGLPASDIHALGAGPTSVYAASPLLGVLFSADGGHTWQGRSRTTGRSFMGRILVDSSNEQHLMAPDMDGGVTESTDGGRTWATLGGVQAPMWVSWQHNNPALIVASNGDSAVQSEDSGRTWHELRLPAGAAIVEASPNDDVTMWAAGQEGEDGKVWVSHDRGSSWQHL